MNDERPGGPIRIGDSEREDAVRRLGEHFEAGRLTAEEHTERVGRALEAKTEADLTALFTDLPGAHQESQNEGWAGPWGWQRPPWTAPENAAGAGPGAGRGAGSWAGPGAGSGTGSWAGPGAGVPGGPFGRPQWAARGPFGRIPFPLLILLGVIGVLASIGCVFGGGHPPFLPLALIVAAAFIIRRRRMERRA